MNPKMGRIEALLDLGFDVVDIESDEASITVVLQRAMQEKLVVFDEADAVELLWGQRLRHARRSEELLAP